MSVVDGKRNALSLELERVKNEVLSVRKSLETCDNVALTQKSDQMEEKLMCVPRHSDVDAKVDLQEVKTEEEVLKLVKIYLGTNLVFGKCFKCQ